MRCNASHCRKNTHSPPELGSVLFSNGVSSVVVDLTKKRKQLYNFSTVLSLFMPKKIKLTRKVRIGAYQHMN